MTKKDWMIIMDIVNNLATAITAGYPPPLEFIRRAQEHARRGLEQAKGE